MKKLRDLFDVSMLKFLLVGVLNTLVGAVLMFLLEGLGYWPSTAIAYTLASVMSFFLNRSFTFRNMECTDSEVAACYIDGLTESPIESVTLENISVSFAPDAQPDRPAMQEFALPRCRLGLYLDNVRKITVKNVTLHGVVGEKLLVGNAESVETEGFDSN